MPSSVASFGECSRTSRPFQMISPSSGSQMPEIVLISVLLPAPLSPTMAVTSPGGMSRSTPISARTGPKCLPTPTRRSIGWAESPLVAATSGAATSGAAEPGASAKVASARAAPSRASAVAASAAVTASSACSAATSASPAVCAAAAASACVAMSLACAAAASASTAGPGGVWPGAEARPASSAGRASSALGLVTGRASSCLSYSRSYRDSRGLAGGGVGTDAQLLSRHELVRDDGRVHVGRGDPFRLEQDRRDLLALLRVGGRVVDQGGRRGLVGPDVHGQRHGGLGLQADRLVDRAALVAGPDVLQADLPGEIGR